MKILFFGSSGWIGKQFCEYLIQNNIVYLETNVRADNEKDVEHEIININPTHIINPTHFVFKHFVFKHFV